METLKNLTPLQWIGIILGVNGVINTYTPQLEAIMGHNAVVWVQLATGMGSAIMGVFVTVLTGQGAQVKSVLKMDGVEKIDVNGKASPALATLAIDPSQDKIAPTPAAVDKVTATAKAAA